MSNPLSFTGSPAEVGQAMARRIGALWQSFHEEWRREKAQARRIDHARVAAFRGILAQAAPWWLEEAGEFAGRNLAAYLDFNCREPRPHKISPPGNCSTILVLGRRSRNAQPLLLKIRDELPFPQVMFRRAIQGRHAVLSGLNIGNLGLAHFLNDAGLAGANNTGGHFRDKETRVGLNDCQILRLVAETAANCNDALQVIQRLLAQKMVGDAGYARGMIFLFADSRGQGLLVECSRQRLAYRFRKEGLILRTNHFLLKELVSETDQAIVGDTVSSMARYRRLVALTRERKAISAKDLQTIARDDQGEFPLCNTSSKFPWRTISAWIHYLKIGKPRQCMSLVCNVAPSLGKFRPTKL